MNAKTLIDFNKKEAIPDIIRAMIEAYEPFRYGGCGQKGNAFLTKMQKITCIYEKYIVNNSCDVFSPKVQMTSKFLALRLWMGI